MTQPMRDLHTELTRLPDEWPPAWKPAPGEILVGKVQRYAQGPTPYGWVHTVLVQEERTGDLWSLWLSSTVLLQQFQQQRPQPGERIGLKYQGKDFEKGYHQKRREAPSFTAGMDRRWARRAQCPRAQQYPRSARALNG